ncbi:YihY/virulence factor BrkB family protein [Allohahella marinimesophila]|uniref:YihY/virulence factor BrkB family protein n=1 Tax=Allohahella marinimesophila TaxID=1054972 RepID=A0ABP7PFN1_9GAMM
MSHPGDAPEVLKPEREQDTDEPLPHEAIKEKSRGRAAQSPLEMPILGWRDILMRVVSETLKDNLGLVSAGVAFYFLLAIFPSIAAFVSIYGLLYDPADAQAQVSSMMGLLPEDARKLMLDQMQALTGGSQKALGFGAVIGILLALVSAMRGTMALMIALNIVYEERETRNFIMLRLVAFALTIASVLFIIVALALIAALPAILQQYGFGSWVAQAFSMARWPLLALLFITILSTMYRLGPSRAKPQWRWVTVGSVVSTLLWLGGSALFSWYVSGFANYNETYGSLGAVVILLMWFYVTAYIILLGAELNSELEHQTAKDSTVGPEEPLGERGAHVADTIGKKP